jgi:hypothetical protein
MNTRNLLLSVGATVLAALTINATASAALLSPRAANNQISHISGTANDANLVTTSVATVSPRAWGNQPATVTGISSDVNPAAACVKNMTGSSPKTIQACAANPLAPMPCCAVASTK